MRKYLIYPLCVVILFSLGSLFFDAIQLKFANLFIDYACEFFLLMTFFILFTALICHEVGMFLTKKETERTQQLQKERDSYKKALDELVEVDIDTQRLRAIIQAKKNEEI